MSEQRKLYGEERRNKLLEILRESPEPVTGSELSRLTHVSRQVIVSDVTLLKAKNEPIIATSQGYIYMSPANSKHYERIITCSHSPEQTEQELNLLVDLGITIKDVKIEHPVYGDLTASIMVSSRREVRQFIQRIADSNASYLSVLANGVHLHTLSADSEQHLDEAEAALKEAGFLIDYIS